MDYACTVLGAVVGPDDAVYCQVGDGAIVVGNNDGSRGLDWVFWPQHGEFANQTNFVTQHNVEDVLDFERGNGCVNEIALFSDGLERLVLDMSSRTVHAPAFNPIFQWLAQTSPTDAIDTAAGIRAYLGSDHINSRTDDDKSLVVATRSAGCTS